MHNFYKCQKDYIYVFNILIWYTILYPFFCPLVYILSVWHYYVLLVQMVCGQLGHSGENVRQHVGEACVREAERAQTLLRPLVVRTVMSQGVNLRHVRPAAVQRVRMVESITTLQKGIPSECQ